MPVTEHGSGFVTASVIDPFGNVLGVMTNVHYLDMLGEERSAIEVTVAIGDSRLDDVFKSVPR